MVEESRVERRRTLTLVIRIGVSALIVFLLLRSANVRETIRSVLRTDHRVWVPAIILYLLGQVVCSYKWKVIAGAAGFQNSFRRYLSYYFIGMFFNLFLPSTVGGDAVKCYYLSNDDPRGRTAPAIYTVLVERFTGLVVLVWMLCIAVLLPAGRDIPAAIKALLVAASVLVLLVTPFVPALSMTFLKRFSWARTMLRDIRVYWQRPRTILAALFWSLVFHLLFITVHVLIGKGIGIEAPLSFYLIVYPAATLAGFIPLALNGIGPREATYIGLFSLVGVKQPDSLAFGILWLGVMICGNLTGALFYISRKGGRVAQTDRRACMPTKE